MAIKHLHLYRRWLHHDPRKELCLPSVLDCVNTSSVKLEIDDPSPVERAGHHVKGLFMALALSSALFTIPSLRSAPPLIACNGQQEQHESRRQC